jgi:queuine tRNA-ribosyltransferase
MFSFTLTKKSKRSSARTGILKTPHGEIQTPAFIPVATLGVVKGAVDTVDLLAAKSQCQITNTFHFLDMNAVATVKKAGGLHTLFSFPKPIFTDSGGFQVFSLGKGGEYGFGKIHPFFPGREAKIKKEKLSLVKLTEEGVRFRSPRDGHEIMLTPEYSAQAQRDLGADFIYLLDICGTVIDTKQEAMRDLGRTNRWFERFLQENKKLKTKGKRPKTRERKQEMFGIVQGGLFKDLRIQSVRAVNDLPVFGIATGGAVGKTKREMYGILDTVAKHIDPARPHHLLGIGDLESIPEFLARGVDLFDCAMPTRMARHGVALTAHERIAVSRGKYKNVFSPIDKKCGCDTCATYPLAALHLLYKQGEMLASRLLTVHNLHFMNRFVADIREKIETGKI